MSYDYTVERQNVFTEQGQVAFLAIRDHVKRLLKKSGAVRLDKAINCCSGSAWTMLACVDRLVELGEIREVYQANVAGQHRIFVSAEATRG